MTKTSKPTETSLSPKRKESLFKSEKADLPKCDLFGCDKIGVLVSWICDTVTKQTQTGYKRFCCKSHMLRYLGKIKMPRYSKKRVQALATTEAMQFDKKE